MHTAIVRDEMSLGEIEDLFGCFCEEETTPHIEYLHGLQAYLKQHGTLVREHYHELEQELEKTDVYISRYNFGKAQVIVRHTEYWEDMYTVFQNPMKQTVTIKIYSTEPIDDLVKSIQTALQELPEYHHEH